MKVTIKFRRHGQSQWRTLRGPLTLAEFNDWYSEWVSRYYDGTEQTECRSWTDAADVLDTVGRNAWAGEFEICRPEY